MHLDLYLSPGNRNEAKTTAIKWEYEKESLLKSHKLDDCSLTNHKLAAWMKTSGKVYKLLTDKGGNYPHPTNKNQQFSAASQSIH